MVMTAEGRSQVNFRVDARPVRHPCNSADGSPNRRPRSATSDLRGPVDALRFGPPSQLVHPAMHRSRPSPSWFDRCLLSLAVFLASAASLAQSPSFRIDELYSNADGTLQYVVLRETAGQNGQNLFAGSTLTAVDVHGTTRTFTFASNLPSPATAGASVLIASVGLQALGIVAPDFVMPDRFLPVDGGTLSLFGGADTLTYAVLPTDGTLARSRGGTYQPNRATNFAGASAAVPVRPVTVVEFYNASLDHYFVSPLAADIQALDSGRLAGWSRTGRTFAAWSTGAGGGTNVSPVCRYYIPPGKGDSHFFSASPSECADIAARVQSDPNYAGFVQETPSAFYIALPDVASGACAAGTLPVYRLWNRRADSNHRYTTDRALRDQMIARGFAAEGYGSDGVAMCAPGLGGTDLVKVSDTTPFAPNCHASGGSLYTNAEVEPYLAINPTNPDNLVAVWQQDRWSNGGARGTLTAFSLDGGRTWEKRQVPYSRCSGGNAANGGLYERATDPWVTFAPDGTAHQIALAFNGDTLAAGSSGAVKVSRSIDGGRSWSTPISIITDGEAAFNDKEAITADPTDARFVYASWDRLERGRGGAPAWFARTTDGGVTWEPARQIHDPGTTAQTLNNIPIVLPDGTLFNFFTQTGGPDGSSLRLMRSPDKGATWEAPIVVAAQQSIGVTDPETGTGVRDAALIASIAVSRAGVIALAWQDARFSGGQRDGIAFSRSLDGGRTWSTPVQVNREPRVQAFIPTVAFRDDGTVGVTYYDFRSNTSDPNDLPTDYWLAQSSDGVTWQESRVAGPFDLATAPNARGLFVGDYMALRTRGNQFMALFGMTNSRDFANRTDIALAFVGTPAGIASVKQSEAEQEVTMYRPSIAPATAMDAAFAAKHAAAVQAALQRRLAGDRTLSVPKTGGDPP